MPKNIKLKTGHSGVWTEKNVSLPDNVPKPWDADDRLQLVSKNQTRLDGQAKVTGSARYTFDIQLPDMLHARILRSPHASAVIRKIDTSRTEKYPGVRAVIRIQDTIPQFVRFAGQEICAVAATSTHAANEALKLIEIQYEKRGVITTIQDAMKPGASHIFDTAVEEQKSEGDEPTSIGSVTQKGNLRGPAVKGNAASVDAALSSSAVIVDAVYETQVQTHSAMETHGVVAFWESSDKLTVWASTQGTFSVRDELANVFQLPKTHVRVITEYMGGGFGAKFGAGVYGIAAAKLAKIAGAPVRLMLDRKEEHIAAGNRPSAVQKLRVGANARGEIQAIKLIAHGTAGVGTGAGCDGPAMNLYFAVPHKYSEQYDVFTHAGAGAAFRAPGHPQGTFALEQSVDELAYKLNMDPLALRRINSKTDSVRLAEYDIGAKRFGWDRRAAQPAGDKGPIKRGFGMANAVWYYIYGTGFQATIEVHSDGSVDLTNGVQDIGGGIRTALAMIVAEELGLQTKDIVIKIGDTQYGLGPASGGSQTTAGITPAARHAAYLAKLKMFEIAAPMLGVPSDDLSVADGRIFSRRDTSKSLAWKQVASKISGDKFSVIGERARDYLTLSPPYIAGVQFADIEVDTETGIIKVNRIVAVHDCGRVINRLTLESQIRGGVIQGLSYALFENRILDAYTGRMVNANFDQYKIAGAKDIPVIETEILDVYTGASATGAMGIGEPATIPTAAAIANAFFHATGKRIRKLPMHAAHVLEALQS